MSFVARSAPLITRAARGPVPARTFAAAKGNVWLSDPGTYPVLAIIGGACIFCASYYTHNIMTNVDIRISKEKRRDTIIRTWEQSKWGHH
mmetsp:Transcript_32782/g.42110  ORF Transcript_32782/g.42110 Transcript_32782/m.42110 type:complete len:90 (-) Transcript_32782:165-434(-)